MPYINISEDVWVDLDDFDTDDLIEELKKRKSVTCDEWTGPTGDELVHDIYMAKHVRNQPYDHLVDQLISTVLRKVV
jgi:predicted DNA binding protein